MAFMAVLVIGCYSEKNADPVATTEAVEESEGAAGHQAVLTKDAYPSASKCAPCHKRIYDEWRASNHAYSAISPMFHKFEQTLNRLASGTVNNFCVRCHMSVGTTMGEPRYLPLWKRKRVSLEGVTCITCHRVNEDYTKGFNGERRIIPGDIHQPMYGSHGGVHLANVVKNASTYPVATNPEETGPAIHLKGIKFPSLNKSEFCASCHQVAVEPGIKLEVVWEQYRDSPARKAGITCQDCHMGAKPGLPDGYEKAPVAVVNGKEINPNGKYPSHDFYGPGYSIAHPGIFPHNKDGEQFSIKSWLKFDWRAGWGTEEFEEKVAEGQLKVSFPAEWEEPDDREEAYRIVEENLNRNKVRLEMRRKVMENSSKVEGPIILSDLRAGEDLDFKYMINNIDPGHNFPSGSLGAQPEIWFNVTLTDPDGNKVWESGYIDDNGDMCDIHSLEVASGKFPYDSQLFNLQTKFLTTNVKGTDREMYLPVNFDFDQRPLIRPNNTPNTVINHPPFIRMESHSIPPLGYKEAKYSVPASKITKPGTYKLSSRLRSRAEPIYFMIFCGATSEMIKDMNKWMLNFHNYTVEFEVK